MSTSTRVSSIQCEGNHGEVLKLTSRHTILLPAGVTEAAAASKDERAASILPPSNALVSLTLQVRVDRKLVPVHDLQRSGLLETIVSFLSKYGTRLRIKAVLDPEVDQSLVEVPILLEPFPSPLTLNFGTSVSHLTDLAFTMHFYTPTTTKPSALSLREELISDTLSPSSSSLVFRTMLKCVSSLAAKYPLVFDLRWLEYLQNQNAHLPSIAKSLRRLLQKVQTDSHSTILQQCLSRLRQRTTSAEHSGISAPPEDHATQMETSSSPQVPPATDAHTSALKDAFFSLLLHAAKRKHAVTKLVLHESQPVTAPDETPAETKPPPSQLLDCAKRDAQDLETSESSALHEHAQIFQTSPYLAVDRGDPRLASAQEDFSNAINPALDKHSSQALPMIYSDLFSDVLFPWHLPPSPDSGGFLSDMLDDDDLIFEAMEGAEIPYIEAQGSENSLNDLAHTVAQLEAMLGLSSSSEDSDEHRAFLGPNTKMDKSFNYADMLIDSPTDHSVETVLIAGDDCRLDELDAKMSALSEQADLDSVDRRMKALFEI